MNTNAYVHRILIMVLLVIPFVSCKGEFQPSSNLNEYHNEFGQNSEITIGEILLGNYQVFADREANTPLGILSIRADETYIFEANNDDEIPDFLEEEMKFLTNKLGFYYIKLWYELTLETKIGGIEEGSVGIMYLFSETDVGWDRLIISNSTNKITLIDMDNSMLSWYLQKE